MSPAFTVFFAWLFVVALQIFQLTASSGAKEKPELNSLVKGFITGSVEAFACCPLETIKTWGQKEAKGPFVCARLVYKESGIGGYWRGASYLVSGAALKGAVRWGMYDKIMDAFQAQGASYGYATNVVAGFCAGGVEAVTVVTPAERLRIQKMEQLKQIESIPGQRYMPHNYNGFGASNICEGVRYLYRGVVPTALKQGTNQAVRMGCQPVILHSISYFYDDPNYGKKSILTNMVAGSVAGVASTFVTQPFDTVKTVMQSKRNVIMDSTANGETMSAMQTACQMYRVKGMKCFFAGLSARAVRVGAATGIHFATALSLKKMHKQYIDYQYNPQRFGSETEIVAIDNDDEKTLTQYVFTVAPRVHFLDIDLTKQVLYYGNNLIQYLFVHFQIMKHKQQRYNLWGNLCSVMINYANCQSKTRSQSHHC